MHKYAKFYFNGIIVSEVIYSSIHKNPILKKPPIKIFFLLYISNLKSNMYLKFASIRESGLLDTFK